MERCVERAEQALSDLLREERSWSYWSAVYALMFADRFADPVNDFREVVFATGVKP
jgi:hypothetical protein